MNGQFEPLPVRHPLSDGHDDVDRVRRYLALCLVEAQRYGDDDDVWVRELVQNARDAGARTISFAVDRGVVVVDDDGSGMSRNVLVTRFLRLFSSSKDSAHAAGCFGVGFWSVLRAGPRQIVVDTNDGAEACGVLVDVAGAAVVERDHHARDRRQSRGTTVRLFGTGFAARPDADAHLRRAIQRHASTVSGLGGRLPPALVLVTARGRESLNTAIDLRDASGVLVTAPVVGAGFRGVVGLSNRPLVELLHHGLRVVQATTLAAVVPTLPMPALHGFGLVVRVDIDDLRVLVDRRTVVEDDTVRAVVAACNAAGARLERRLLDGAAPLPWWRRAVEVLTRAAFWQTASAALTAIVVGVVIGGLVLSLVVPEQLESLRRAVHPAMTTAKTETRATTARTTTGRPPQSLTTVLGELGPPQIDPRDDDLRGIDLSTRRVVHDNLALQVLTVADDERGLVARPVHAVDDVDGARQGRPIASARFVVTDRVVLPSSQALWPIEALVDGTATPISLTDDGLPLLLLDAGAARTIDVAFAINDRPVPARVPAPVVLAVPTLTPLAAVATGRSRIEAVAAVAQEVSARVRYSADVDDALRFRTDPRPLVDKALALGIGDCDVINTVLVRALQQAGMEARLAIGVIVRDDVVASALHAWVEVVGDDGGWLVVDASPPEAIPVAGTAAAAVASRALPFILESALTTAATATATATTATATTAATTTTTTMTTPAATTVTSAEPPSSSSPDPASSSCARVGGGVVGLAVVAISLLLLRRRRRRRTVRAEHIDEAAVTALIVGGLRSGAAEHLGLWHRPILPTSHGTIDLTTARRLARRGQLAIGRRHPWLDRRVRLLDPLDARLRALRPFLPVQTVIDDVSAVATTNERWRALQARVDASLSGVALHTDDIEVAADVREVLLHTTDGRRHHLLLSPRLVERDDEQVWSLLLDQASSLRALQLRGVK